MRFRFTPNCCCGDCCCNNIRITLVSSNWGGFGSCDDCASLSGDYILTPATPPEGYSCGWELLDIPHPCTYSIPSPGGPRNLTWDIFVHWNQATKGLGVVIRWNYLDIPSSWQANFSPGGTTPCQTLTDGTGTPLTWDATGLGCDIHYTNITCDG